MISQQTAAALASGDTAAVQTQVSASNTVFVASLIQAMATGSSLTEAYQAADVQTSAAQAQALAVLVPATASAAELPLLAMANPDMAIQASSLLLNDAATLTVPTP
ncbi:MAG: hypothetical protein H7833_04350 [Magnetococcus sp. DMHC-1]|nr:hypothetical protein [Magnetococcales bacterium]